MGLTCVLAVGFDLGFEPFAVVVRRYWTWTAVANGPAWYGVPWSNFPGRAAGTLLVLIVTTPWLNQQKPGGTSARRPSAGDVVFLNLFFAAQNAARGFWLASGFGLVISILLTIAEFLESHRWPREFSRISRFMFGKVFPRILQKAA